MASALIEEYRSKRVTADAAVSLISSNVNIAMGMAVAEPPALLAALAARVESGSVDALRLWYFHSLSHAAETVLRYELLDRIRPHCMFLSKVERALVTRGDTEGRSPVEFVPTAFSDSPRLLTEHVEVDTFITTVSPMDQHGWFTFGTSNDYGTTVARSAKRLVVEVNANMPRVFGDSLLHISEVDALVANDVPLPEVPEAKIGAEDRIIAAMIASMIEDGACLQMGIGSLPNAVCSMLEERRDLGIHTELMTPALAKLVECGAVTNRLKSTYPSRSVFTFAMGNAKFYRFLNDNPSMHSAPVHVVNDPRHISKNDNVVSVNATLQVDLSGACNSEHVMGRQFSGSGGQLDFVRGASASRGGKSIIACRSTAKGGSVSRIVTKLNGPVTTPRNDTHIVVTEFGTVDLRGKSLRERADSLIAIAHPDFRKSLRQEYEDSCWA
jgi:itaconate CoA-transferase